MMARNSGLTALFRDYGGLLETCRYYRLGQVETCRYYRLGQVETCRYYRLGQGEVENVSIVKVF